VLAADAVHFYEELERDRPFFIVADLPDMYRGFDVVREMCEEQGSVLVAGHDADVRRRFPDRVGDLVVRVSGTEPA
jgi:hypothetical protein